MIYNHINTTRKEEPMETSMLIRMASDTKKWLVLKKEKNGTSINWQINKILEAQRLREKKGRK